MTEKDQPGKSEPTGKESTSWWVRRVKAFGHAGRGIWFALMSQAHFQIHVLAAIAVVALGFFKGRSIIKLLMGEKKKKNTPALEGNVVGAEDREGGAADLDPEDGLGLEDVGCVGLQGAVVRGQIRRGHRRGFSLFGTV